MLVNPRLRLLLSGSGPHLPIKKAFGAETRVVGVAALLSVGLAGCDV